MFRNPDRVLAVYISSSVFRHRRVMSTRKKRKRKNSLFSLQFISGEFHLSPVAHIIEATDTAPDRTI